MEEYIFRLFKGIEMKKAKLNKKPSKILDG